jgi:hypothetical protein
MKPSDYPLRSLQSRAAARSLLDARKASAEDGLRFQVVSILDGKPMNLDCSAARISGRNVLIHDIPPRQNEE